MAEPRDPTQTLFLRNQASKEVDRRYELVNDFIKESMLEPDSVTVVAPERRYAFTRDADGVNSFSTFLRGEIHREVTGTNHPESFWLNGYIDPAYSKGVQRSDRAIQKELPAQPVPFLESPLSNPAHLERAKLIHTRTFTQLNGINETTAQQITRVLTDGILRGESVDTITKNMINRVDKIGKVRARLMVRTEIVNAHNTAAILEAERLESALGEEIKMIWYHSQRENPRLDHLSWHNTIMSKALAASRIGEPNCRCSVTAHIVA